MKQLLFILVVFASVNFGFSQKWMTNLEVAERLAITQNKLMVVVWENAYYSGTPVYVNYKTGKEFLVENMFAEPVLDSLLWSNFVPVVLNEGVYTEWYNTLKNTRSTTYLDKFNDDTLKVMDANGNILNIKADTYIENITEFVAKYSLDTSFLSNELVNYKREQNFYSAFYLASKYMDFAFFNNSNVRAELVNLAAIYLDEASRFLERETLENKETLRQRVSFLEIQEHLLLENPKKVLRQLNRIKETDVANANSNLRAFLYFSAYRMLQDEQNASVWRPEISNFDTKKIMSLIQNTTN